jgi:hypothetical protein
VLFFTVLYSTALYSTALHYIMLFETSLHSMLYCTTLHCSVLQTLHNLLHRTLLCCAMLCCTAHYCIELHRTALICNALYDGLTSLYSNLSALHCTVSYSILLCMHHLSSHIFILPSDPPYSGLILALFSFCKMCTLRSGENRRVDLS